MNIIEATRQAYDRPLGEMDLYLRRPSWGPGFELFVASGVTNANRYRIAHTGDINDEFSLCPKDVLATDWETVVPAMLDARGEGA